MWMLVSMYYLRVMNIYNNDAFIIIVFTFILCEKKNAEHFSFRVNLLIIILVIIQSEIRSRDIF